MLVEMNLNTAPFPGSLLWGIYLLLSC